MYFQNNNDYILLPFPNVGLFQGSPELGVDVLAPELEDGLQPVSEQAGRYLDGITVDPLGGIFVASSDSDIPPNQIAQVPPGPPRGLCIPQTLSDQHRVDLSPDDMAATKHIAVVDVGVEPDVEVENGTPANSTSRRPRNLAKRRDLRSRKSGYINDIRMLMEMGPRTPKVEVLCAAVQRLEGTVPQLAYESNTNQMKLAYKALHKSTGSQGRLKHVECLKLVIKALKGLPTLDPVFVGPSNGSTQ